MKDRNLQFDRKSHVLYSKPCRRSIRAKISLHYAKDEQEAVWEKVQRQYVEFLSDWRTDLGGRKNFHNGAGGTYDCIALIAYYTVCKDVTNLAEIEEMESSLFLPAFRFLSKFVDCNRPMFRKLMYRSFLNAGRQCRRWHDYEMHVLPFDKEGPIRYEFTACPVAEFARLHGLLEVMPALCNPDYTAMELIHAKLVRRTTCSNGDRCDYAICGDKDSYAMDHPEYRDEAGYRRNV